MGDIPCIGVLCQITWRSSLYPIGPLVELLIPIGPLFQLLYTQFSNFVKAYSRTAEKRKHFCAALEYVLPVNRNLFESGRGHSGQWLYSTKMATAIAHQRNILEIQKSVEVLG